MNKITSHKIVAFETSRKNKIALANYSAREGRTIKNIMNEALNDVLDEQMLTKPKKRRTKQ